MNCKELWRRITSTHYVRALEAAARTERALNHEIMLLRAENRALLHSILGIAGIPPILAPGLTQHVATIFTPSSPAAGHSESPTPSRGGDASLPAPTSSSPQTAESDSSSRQSETRNGSSPPQPSTARQVATPLRKRSWHQINRILELESARKPEQQS